ncbi:hypothetical protein [uncultured Gimesia sp.]|uniref:hypothetical protein n=1 Tax=uncultured Gimesia sp. TaxID=1678688 RepID=UPI0026038CC5|nr:hypothetical protein [uncultured Gimesia sp.]
MSTSMNTRVLDQDDLQSFGKRLRSRLSPGFGQRPGRPSDPSWTLQRKLSMSEDTLSALETVSEKMSTLERQVSPMQVAALLIEDATHQLMQQLSNE